MKTQFISLTILIALATVTLTSCKKNKPATPDETENSIIKNQFAADAGGWTIVGDAQGGFVAASFSPNGGVLDGYIYANDDVLGGTWYFSAPATFLGNKSVYFGSTLKFSLFQHSDMANQYEAADIIFKNGDQQISLVLKKYPENKWTPYSIKIDENSGWLKGDYNSSTIATKADIEAVLSNVTAFLIRGEYETGPDEGGLDDVQLIK